MSTDLSALKREDTYLHTFGIRNGNKLVRVLYSRITVCLLLLYGICCMMLTWCKPFHKPKQYYLLWCTFGALLWIWTTFAVLSVNRMALHSIAKKFDFWLKLVFVFVFVIAYSIWRVATTHHIQTNGQDFDANLLYIIHTILIGIDFILLVLYYSLIHGMQLSYRTKQHFGCLLAMICTCMTLQLLLCSANNEQDIKLTLYAPYLSLSLYTVCVSSILVLTVFTWKSVYLIRRYKRKSPPISIIDSKSMAKMTSTANAKKCSHEEAGNDVQVQLKKLPKFEPVNTDSRYLVDESECIYNAASPKLPFAGAGNMQRSPSQYHEFNGRRDRYLNQDQVCCVDLKCVELQLEQNGNGLPMLPMIVQTHNMNECNIDGNLTDEQLRCAIPITRHCNFPCPEISQRTLHVPRNDVVLPISAAM